MKWFDKQAGDGKVTDTETQAIYEIDFGMEKWMTLEYDIGALQ